MRSVEVKRDGKNVIETEVLFGFACERLRPCLCKLGVQKSREEKMRSGGGGRGEMGE